MSDLMDGINGAIDAAVKEAGAESREVVSEDASEEQVQAVEPEDEGESAEEPAPESDDEPGDGGDDEQPVQDWLDRLDELPTSELPPRVAKLRADRDRMASEIGEMKKRLAELEAVRQGKQEPQQSAEPEDPMPAYPTEEDDFNSVVRKMDAIAEWRARQAVKGVDQEYRQKFQTVEEREQQQQLHQQQQYFAQQAQRIEGHPEYSENVGQMMSAMVADNPAWQQALASPQGWDQLFDYAKHLAAKNSKMQQRTTKKATARQRAVPRGSTTEPKKAEPSVELPEDRSNISGVVDAIVSSWRG